MDEIIKEIKDPLLGKGIKSDRLLGLTELCPDDGAVMKATGCIYQHKLNLEWFIEYWCPLCQEAIMMSTPRTGMIAKNIADDVLEKKNKE